MVFEERFPYKVVLAKLWSDYSASKLKSLLENLQQILSLKVRTQGCIFPSHFFPTPFSQFYIIPGVYIVPYPPPSPGGGDDFKAFGRVFI